MGWVLIGYTDSGWASWHLKLLATWLFVQQLVQTDNMENLIKGMHHCACVRGIYQLLVDSPRKGPIILKALSSDFSIGYGSLESYRPLAVWYKTKFGSQNFGYQLLCLFLNICNVFKNMFNLGLMKMWWSIVVEEFPTTEIWALENLEGYLLW